MQRPCGAPLPAGCMAVVVPLQPAPRPCARGRVSVLHPLPACWCPPRGAGAGDHGQAHAQEPLQGGVVHLLISPQLGEWAYWDAVCNQRRSHSAVHAWWTGCVTTHLTAMPLPAAPPPPNISLQHALHHTDKQTHASDAPAWQDVSGGPTLPQTHTYGTVISRWCVPFCTPFSIFSLVSGDAPA